MMGLLEFWRAHATELTGMLMRHVLLVVLATGVAIMVGVPLGIVTARWPRVGRPLTAIASVVQAIPSLALFGFLLPLPLVGGVGARTALVALILYGILPILQTTAAGLTTVPPSLIHAATAMGLTSRQRLVLIELPLALPSILAGIRVSAVVGVGTATIAAAIGAGGLGEYIFRGLAMVDATVILAGAVPAAALALTADGLFAWIGRRLARRRRRSTGSWMRWVANRRSSPALAGSRPIVALAASAGLIALLIYAAFHFFPAAPHIIVGSKNFTEQLILGELIAQTIERQTDLRVERKLNLGGTLICERALASGAIDVYVEYSGTALTAIFKQRIVRDRQQVLATVRDRYASTGRTILAPLGFNNTFAILVRGETARGSGISTISEAARFTPEWRAGFGYEFLEREDGFRGLAKTYGLTFREPPRVMDLNLSYRALASRQVDLIAGDATAGAIAALDLTMLVDDRQYFPPYDAVPVMRSATLLAHPELRDALQKLAGRLDEATMRRMNEAADIKRQEPAQIARAFLEGLVGR
jgi:osmoprotectant transport system substrate-binding protein/osmoprotectant transport system permease protein